MTVLLSRSGGRGRVTSTEHSFIARSNFLLFFMSRMLTQIIYLFSLLT